MKVLEIIPGYTGGIATHVHNIVKGMKRNDISIDIMGFRSDIESAETFCKDILKKNGKNFPIDSPKQKGIIKFVREISQIIKENGPYNLVHIHMYGHRLLCFSVAARLTGVKRIAAHAHIASEKDQDKIKNRIRHKLEQEITCIFANEYISCSMMASEYVFGKKNVGQVMHIPNSIDPKFFTVNLAKKSDKDFRHELGIDDKTLLIGHVGYFGYQKNHPYMVELIEMMSKARMNFKWLFVGVGDEMETIKRTVHERGLDNCVQFLGYRTDIPYILSQIDVMVLPSIFEGLPTVAIESQAVGTPCILSTNVSRESDMNIGICEFVDLSDKKRWIEKIVQCSKISRPTPDEILTAFREKKFTNDAAADLYADYIDGKIKTYTL